MAGVSAFPEHPAWDFITTLYVPPGVAPACPALQERHDIDVTLMLFCLWDAIAYGRILDTQMAALTKAVRDWREATVLPLRAAGAG